MGNTSQEVIKELPKVEESIRVHRKYFISNKPMTKTIFCKMNPLPDP